MCVFVFVFVVRIINVFNINSVGQGVRVSEEDLRVILVEVDLVPGSLVESED